MLSTEQPIAEPLYGWPTVRSDLQFTARMRAISNAYARVMLQNGSDMADHRLVECPICPKVPASSSCRSGRRSIGTSRTSSCRPSRTLVYNRYGLIVFSCLQRSCQIYGGSRIRRDCWLMTLPQETQMSSMN